jgi:hypothetical protein
MTPEQITIRGAESIRDPWTDAVADGWCVRYPGSREEDGESDERGVGADAKLSARGDAFKVVGVFLLIVALVAYLVVPFNTFIRVQIREQAPTRVRPIPMTPRHEGVRLGA